MLNNTGARRVTTQSRIAGHNIIRHLISDKPCLNAIRKIHEMVNIMPICYVAGTGRCAVMPDDAIRGHRDKQVCIAFPNHFRCLLTLLIDHGPSFPLNLTAGAIKMWKDATISNWANRERNRPWWVEAANSTWRELISNYLSPKERYIYLKPCGWALFVLLWNVRYVF